MPFVKPSNAVLVGGAPIVEGYNHLGMISYFFALKFADFFEHLLFLVLL
jgi:hypothetical protein